MEFHPNRQFPLYPRRTHCPQRHSWHQMSLSYQTLKRKHIHLVTETASMAPDYPKIMILPISYYRGRAHATLKYVFDANIKCPIVECLHLQTAAENNILFNFCQRLAAVHNSLTSVFWLTLLKRNALLLFNTLITALFITRTRLLEASRGTSTQSGKQQQTVA